LKDAFTLSQTKFTEGDNFIDKARYLVIFTEIGRVRQ